MPRLSLIYICIFLITLATAIGCRKSISTAGNPAAVQVYNAMSDGTVLYMNMNETRPAIFRTNRLINNNTYTTSSGVLYLHQSPQPFQVYSRPDTLVKDNPILTGSVTYENGSIYSMFFHGTKESPKMDFVKDNIPQLSFKDSITHFRFANFSEWHDVSVNIKGETNGSFISRIDKKSLSNFISLPTNNSIIKYEFEIRDFASGNILSSFVANNINNYLGYNNTSFWLFTASTIVVTGKIGGSGVTLPRSVRMLHR